jgi:hypothetical protein
MFTSMFNANSVFYHNTSPSADGVAFLSFQPFLNLKNTNIGAGIPWPRPVATGRQANCFLFVVSVPGCVPHPAGKLDPRLRRDDVGVTLLLYIKKLGV